MARAIAADPGQLRAARTKLVQDHFGKNTLLVKKSKLALAEDLARLAGLSPIYPLSVDCIEAVAAALKEAGFRSASSYISELRLRHIELDFQIPPALGRAIKLAQDSTERDIGPAQKAEELRLRDVDFGEHNELDIIGVADSYTVAVGWLLREIELGAITACTDQITIEGNVGEELITLLLPTSKMDQSGKGAARRLAHECGRTSRLELCSRDACPVCAVLRQLVRLQGAFAFGSRAALLESELPLFPRKDGTRPTKPQVIEAWRVLPKFSSHKPPLGHSARRSGAKRRARLGWSLWQIQFLSLIHI